MEWPQFAAGNPADDVRERVPVMSPRLPAAEQLLPYLRRIDRSRIYTNYGPLVTELEARLTTLLDPPEGGLATASSGTAALVAGMMACVGKVSAARPLALIPDFTFVATALAAEQCGLAPHIADVDPATWALDPERLYSHPQLDRVAVVVPVAPFGMPLAQAPWREFRDRTGIPVIIDAAAGFESVCADPRGQLGDIPVMVSFHATKSFATGEGGCIAATDVDLVARAACALNFGFHDSRQCRAPSINGKLSEYHAAVGLAELDGWARKSADFAAVADAYRQAAADAGLAVPMQVAPATCSSYSILVCDDAAQSARVQRRLEQDGIEFRLWYGLGIHRHPHFSARGCDPLPVAQRIAPCTIGLPVAPDMDRATIRRVVASVAAALGESPSRFPGAPAPSDIEERN